MRLLIVDPSRLVHQIIGTLVHGTELAVTSIENGATALALIETERFDMVCAAYYLPDMTGIEFCESFRKFPFSDTTPFLLLTSIEGEQLATEAMQVGVTEVFQREDSESLVTFIQRLLVLHEPLKAKVLLVDDSPSQRAVYRNILEACGALVSDHPDAAGALAAARREDFDVLITDVVLGGIMSGLGLVNAIRRLPGRKGDIPILALTAFDDSSRRIELFHLGVNDYVTKPIAEAEFRMRVRNLVASGRQMAQLHDRHESARETAFTLMRAIEQVPSAVAIAGADGRIEYANPRFSALTGARPPLPELPLAHFAANGELPLDAPFFGEQQKRRLDGSTYWAYETVSPVCDQEGRVTHYISIHDDTSEIRALREQIDFHARHDHLTGLLNRRQLEDCVNRAIAAWHDRRTPCSLALIELRNLRATNDALGFEAGDTMLRETAAELQTLAGKNLLAARVESGRLAVLLEGMSNLAAAEETRRLVTRLNTRSISWGLRRLPVDVCAGMSSLAEHIDRPEILFQEADSAVRVAHLEGSGEVIAFDGDDPRIMDRHGTKHWLNVLHDALENDRFVLYQQLIHPLRPQLPTGFELLLRLENKSGQIVAPGLFLPSAEYYGLMPQIDRWVMTHAFDWISRLDEENSPPFYAINLSGQSLSDPAFVESASKLLRKVPGERVLFEITESIMVQDSAPLQHFIRTALQHGCRFGLDDFGSGFASYSQLKQQPVQILKIDGQMVRNIGTDQVDRVMVKSIGEIGRAMNMQTIGEFVENALILETLREIDITYAQGYHLGKPAPLI